MPAAFIDDGYTIDGHLDADTDLDIEAVDFKYRPATARESSGWIQHRDKLTGDERGQRDAKFMSDHVVSWSLKNSRGEPVQPTAANCERVHPVVSGRMLDIISGYAKGDAPSPEAAKGN